MKPKNVVFFILLILCGLLTVSFLFPKKGIELTEKWVLHFPTFDELFGNDDSKIVDISDIVKQNQVPEDSLDLWKQDMAQGKINDSVIVYYDPKPINPNEISRKLEFPNGDKRVLFSFFKELSEVRSNGKLIRIMHYGDSQIEADRISSYLRNRLQGQFGGSGPGLFPAVPPYDFDAHIKTEYSPGWLRYTGFVKRDTNLTHNRYGILSSFSRYAPLPLKKDSLATDTINIKPHLQEYHAWLRVNHSPYSLSNVKSYAQCRIFYGFNKYPVNLKVYAGEQEIDKKILLPSETVQMKKWAFNETPPFLKFEFSGYDSPDFYALALDSRSGVAVDNIPLRGANGYIFTNNDFGVLHAMFQQLNPKLVIMQFGGNVAPTMLDNYDYYESGFYRQLITLKKLVPDVSIIVIGIADMSIKEKDQFVSYPNIELIRNALKNACFRANAAYWDTYEAMGGANSMPSWVFSDPPLAEKDFIHFTIRGSTVIAQMFYKALMFEYNEYFNQNIKNIKPAQSNVETSSK
jgi:hypothetical protein